MAGTHESDCCNVSEYSLRLQGRRRTGTKEEDGAQQRREKYYRSRGKQVHVHGDGWTWQLRWCKMHGGWEKERMASSEER